MILLKNCFMISNEYFFNKYKNYIIRIPFTHNKSVMSNVICIKGCKAKLFITRLQIIKNENECTTCIPQIPLISNYDDINFYINIETWHGLHNLFLKNINYNLNNTYYLTASPKHEDIKRNIIYINHDITVPTDIFNIRNLEKKYKGISTSSIAPFKNLYLIKNNEYFKIVQRENDIEKISNSLNQSLFGGIFSKIEGGCFSSAEFLSCGLPVLSVYCKGGREVHYNESNSVMCDPNIDDVLLKTKIIYQNCINGVYNNEKIREDFLNTVNYNKIKFSNLLKNVLDKIEININHQEFINDLLSLRYIARNIVV